MRAQVLAAGVAMGLVFGDFADTTWWKGADGAYLNDVSNWNGDAPFKGVSANDMGFGDIPSSAYTVRLSNNLVCDGMWRFVSKPITLTWDLNGYALTYLKPYADHEHGGFTNVIRNGTIAFTNETGQIQEARFWSANNGAAVFFRNAGFVGNFAFTDNGTKALEVTDGTKWQGSLEIYGSGSRGLVSGDGTLVDLRGDRADSWEDRWGVRLNVGGEGDRAKLDILDGAIVTNGTWLGVGLAENRGYASGTGASLVVSNATLHLRGTETFAIGGSIAAGSDQAKTSHANEARFLDGARVNVGNSQVIVGDTWSASNLLYVADEGTTFTALEPSGDRPFMVGQNSCWNRFRLTDGAKMNGGFLAAGGHVKSYSYTEIAKAGTTSCWNRVTIDEGATLVAAGSLYAPYRHMDDTSNGTLAKSLMASNVFEITSGAHVTVGKTVSVGAFSPSVGNRFVIQGKDSSLTFETSESDILVGQDGGQGNGLEVLDGATVAAFRNLWVGRGAADTLAATASNNYARVEQTDLTVENIDLGERSNGANRLWVGDGAVVRTGGVVLRGAEQELVVSNGTLRILCDGQSSGEGLRLNETEASGRHRFSFHGCQAKFLNGSFACDFKTACTFAFHVPDDGYAEAVVESMSAPIRFSDDTVFSFDFSALSARGARKMTLVRYSGENAADARIVMSDALLTKIQRAAEAALPRSRVTLSPDKRLLSLRVPSTQGLVMIIR